MKKFLLFILILAAVIGLYVWKDKVDPGVISLDVKKTETGFEPDPSNATFIFDGEAVTLSNGKNSDEDVESGLTSETMILEDQGAGDLNNDGKDDTVVFIARSGGGSGVFIYAAAFVSGPVSYKGTNAIYLGDRISPQLVVVKNGIATLNYLDRKADEPFSAEPTVPFFKEFVYKDGQFQER